MVMTTAMTDRCSNPMQRSRRRWTKRVRVTLFDSWHRHGADGLVSTIDDNPAYEIGRGGANDNRLGDGTTFEIPQNVSVVIDAGALLKLRDSKIVAGSESVDEDRSLASIQVLGTPEASVIFTSYDDESVGLDTNPIDTSPVAGDWAGIEIRNDVDYAEGRPVWGKRRYLLGLLVAC